MLLPCRPAIHKILMGNPQNIDVHAKYEMNEQTLLDTHIHDILYLVFGGGIRFIHDILCFCVKC